MSRPITIRSVRQSETEMTPDSLGRSAGALRIVETICGSSNSLQEFPSRQRFDCSKSNCGFPATPEFQIGPYMNRGGRVIGTNGCAFGTPPSRPVVAWVPPGSPIYAAFPACSAGPHTEQMACSPTNNAPISLQAFVNVTHDQIPPIEQPRYEIPSGPQMVFMEGPFSPSVQLPMPMDYNRPQMHYTDGYGPRVLVQHQRVQNMPTYGFCPPVQIPFKTAITDNNTMSDLLMSYRNNAIKNLKLSEIRGYVLEFSKDQLGSRFIQQRLSDTEHCSLTEKNAIFDEVFENAGDLVNDIFGNYVVQKFFEFGSEKHRQRLVATFQGNVMCYAFQMYACRVLQKALEFVSEPQQLCIIEEIKENILQCIEHQNGNHVVQKAVECVNGKYVQFVVDALLQSSDNVLKMSVHTYGCRVVQRVLEYCAPAQTVQIFEKLHHNFDNIVFDQYGNYVVQHMVVHGSPDDRKMILGKLMTKLLMFAEHKFASNVLEKCLLNCDAVQRGEIINQACTQMISETPLIVQMMKDQYANYVVQRMIDVADSAQRKFIMLAIKPHIQSLRTFQYGKHIIAKLDKHFQRQTTHGASDALC